MLTFTVGERGERERYDFNDQTGVMWDKYLSSNFK
jgi:hypothetical protein